MKFITNKYRIVLLLILSISSCSNNKTMDTTGIGKNTYIAFVKALDVYVINENKERALIIIDALDTHKINEIIRSDGYDRCDLTMVKKYLKFIPKTTQDEDYRCTTFPPYEDYSISFKVYHDQYRVTECSYDSMFKDWRCNHFYRLKL